MGQVVKLEPHRIVGVLLDITPRIRFATARPSSPRAFALCFLFARLSLASHNMVHLVSLAGQIGASHHGRRRHAAASTNARLSARLVASKRSRMTFIYHRSGAREYVAVSVPVAERALR